MEALLPLPTGPFIYDPALHAEFKMLQLHHEMLAAAYKLYTDRLRLINRIEGLQHSRYKARVKKWLKADLSILSYPEWLVEVETLEGTIGGHSFPQRQWDVSIPLKEAVELSPDGYTDWFFEGLHAAIMARVPRTDEVTRADFTVTPTYTVTKKHGSTLSAKYEYQEVRQ